MTTSRASITVIEVTYVNTQEHRPAEFIGLWYEENEKPRLLLLGLDRVDMLALERGDRGTLTRSGERWEFIPRGN